jgi:hypothetical protein
VELGPWIYLLCDGREGAFEVSVEMLC